MNILGFGSSNAPVNPLASKGKVQDMGTVEARNVNVLIKQILLRPGLVACSFFIGMGGAACAHMGNDHSFSYILGGLGAVGVVAFGLVYISRDVIQGIYPNLRGGYLVPGDWRKKRWTLIDYQKIALQNNEIFPGRAVNSQMTTNLSLSSFQKSSTSDFSSSERLPSSPDSTDSDRS